MATALNAYNITVEELDESHPVADHPSNVKVRMWPHQLTLLHRCKMYENKQVLMSDFQSLREMHPNITSQDYIRSQIGVIGDSVGSGKSYVVLALIKENDISHFGSTIKSYGQNKIVFCYSERNVNVRTNLLVVPHNLITQWETYITKFSDDFKYLVLSKTKHVDTLQDNPSSVSNYNIILVSATQYNRVAHFLTSRSFKMQRIIFDEVDNMNISNCVSVESNFYWFVTASYGNLLYPRGYCKMDPLMGRNRWYAHGLKNSGFVKNIFVDLYNNLPKEMVKLIVVKNKAEYVQSSILLPELQVLTIKCKTPISINILNGFVDREIIRSLNAGDLASAMQRINPSQRTNQESIVTMQIERYVRELNNFDVRLQAAHGLHFDTDEQRNQEISRLTRKKEEYQTKIDGIKDRIQTSNTCPVCFDDIVKKSIAPCCSNAFCFMCINIWLAKHSSCPMCKQMLPATDLFVVDDNAEPHPKIDQDTVNEMFDKLKNLEIIVKNEAIKNKGKILIYSSYDMSFVSITGVLDKLGVSYMYLKGIESSINRAIQRFGHGDLQVLLVNGRSYGAGMNLECTTDIVMFHRMESEAEKQIIGRAQRWPRTTPLKVHYLLHDNELPSL